MISKVNRFFILVILPFVVSLWIAAAVKHFVDLPEWTHDAMNMTSLSTLGYALSCSWVQISEQLKGKQNWPEVCGVIVGIFMIIMWSIVVWG